MDDLVQENFVKAQRQQKQLYDRCAISNRRSSASFATDPVLLTMITILTHLEMTNTSLIPNGQREASTGIWWLSKHLHWWNNPLLTGVEYQSRIQKHD